MHLESNDAGLGSFVLLFVDDFRHEHAINIVLQPISLGDDTIVIPVFAFDFTLQLIFVADGLSLFRSIGGDRNAFTSLHRKARAFSS